ncbi:MAG: FtsX-like permease family protein [Christensenellales bacterium]
MLFRTSLKQTLRTPVKLLSYFLVNALAAALLCVGLNMERSAQDNLAAAEDCFTTIAIPEVWGMVNKTGTLANEKLIDCAEEERFSEEMISLALTEDERTLYGNNLAALMNLITQRETLEGYAPTIPGETEYDLSALRAMVGVEEIDLRGRFGAYCGEPLAFGDDFYFHPCDDDVILFAIKGDEPVTLSPFGNETKLALTVLEHVNPYLEYEETLEFLNIAPEILESGLQQTPEGNAVVLEPGKQYIMMLRNTRPSSGKSANGRSYLSGPVTYATLGHTAYYFPTTHAYSAKTQRQQWIFSPVPGVLPPLAECSKGFYDTETGAFFQAAIEGVQMSASSFTVITTKDLSTMLAFHSGKVHIPEGRAFTEEEYASGAKVCLVSAAMAELNGWHVGDTLPLSFYECKPRYYGDEMETARLDRLVSTYIWDSGGVFDEGEFTIVGLFDGRVELSQDQNNRKYGSTNDKLHMLNVIIPEASVTNAPAPVISKYTSSIRLENSKAIDFITAMQASGLMDSAEGEYGSYELRLTVYDQGYSLVAPGLNQLSRVSRLTLLLSAAAAGLAVLVLAVIHVLRMRREIAAMRSLGTKKRQIMAIALSGVLLVCLLGAAVGACAGHVLSAEVTERVLASAEEDAADTTFTAMMGEETAKEFTFALESEPRLALAAGGAVVAVFAVFAALLLAAELQKPPMAQLGVKE